ncbi:MAG: hypothetical protein CM15mV122_290 [uncultured marine virus]|nr:MAG: hypothetical protein CM15mV122_290 [uncultured marine virus]
MLLSGKWGPYNVIGQCLDRVKRIKTDNLQRFLEIRIRKLSVEDRNMTGYESREYPNSSDRA